MSGSTKTDTKPDTKTQLADMVTAAGAWMLAAVEAEGRRWNVISVADHLVGKAMERFEMDADRRGIMLEDVTTTPDDLVEAMRKAVVKAKADAAKAPAQTPVTQTGSVASPGSVANTGSVSSTGSVTSTGTGTAAAATKAS